MEEAIILMKNLNLKIIICFIVYLFGLYTCFHNESPFLYQFLLTILLCLVVLIIYRQEAIFLKKIYSLMNQIGLQINLNHKHKNLNDVLETLVAIENIIMNKSLEKVELKKVKTDFISNVSHELKTPIFSLQGYVDTLLNGTINDSENNVKFLEKIKKQSDRIQNLVNDIVKISMLESKDLKLSFQSVPLNDFLHEIEETFKPALHKRNSNLIFPKNLEFSMLCNKENLIVVFENLITNAINYSNHGDITIIIKEKENKMIDFRIIDHGIGIDEKSIDRIFERFYRVDTDRSRKTGGTGLGLAIVKHILLAHNSSIKVSSKIGVGTEFSFTIKKS